ncbi:hypothetical protein Hdeb2414_s0008g00287661 [Helianthus debilis subsp. tardiflorus]
MSRQRSRGKSPLSDSVYEVGESSRAHPSRRMSKLMQSVVGDNSAASSVIWRPLPIY